MKYSVLEYLEDAVLKYGDKIAFVDEHSQITFRETKERALCIADAICAKTSMRRQPVLVYLPKGVDCITSFMGILYSGNFYTPTDIKFPFPKIKSILDVLDPKLILTDSKNKLSLLKNGITENKILDVSLIPYSGSTADSKFYLKDVISTDPVYTFFTSGSTGIPKGVIINNLSILDYIDWACEKFKIDENTIMGNQSAFYFDISTQDIYATLKCGATLVIIPESNFIFPARAVEFINKYKVNYLYWVPSAFVNISKLDILEELSLPYVKTMIFGGEVMPVKHLNYWRRHVPSLEIISNVCGPTETTVNYSCYIVDREFKEDEMLPLGQPIPNRELLLLDDNGKCIKEINVLGELYIRGVALSPGYYNNPKKTSEMFVQNPLNNLYPELVYKTGDLAYYNKRGELVYAGRKDFQIKHMGYRIELGEIETAVVSCNRVDEACCLYDKNNSKIILCYVGDMKSSELAKKLSSLLPKYMIPTHYEQLEIMPHNANGKIDRQMLKKKFVEE